MPLTKTPSESTCETRSLDFARIARDDGRGAMMRRVEGAPLSRRDITPHARASNANAENIFVETPAALRQALRERTNAWDDGLARARRTEDSTTPRIDVDSKPKRFDDMHAMTPYFGRPGMETMGQKSMNEELEATSERTRDDVGEMTRARAPAATTERSFGARWAMMEVLLWRDCARSAMHFSLGMCVLLALQFFPRVAVSGVSVWSYAGMTYVAYKYVFAVMFPRLSYGLELNDRAVGDVAQRMAISFNAFTAKHRELLAGRDNKAVFWTFSSLYVVASLGRVLSARAVAMTLWIAAFTLPIVFETYRHPITSAYMRANVLAMSRFNALSVPKRWCGGVAAGVVTFACVSLSARLCLSFLALVAFRIFRETHIREVEAFEQIVRSAGRRMSRSMNEFAMIVSPAVRHRRR